MIAAGELAIAQLMAMEKAIFVLFPNPSVQEIVGFLLISSWLLVVSFKWLPRCIIILFWHLVLTY